MSEWQRSASNERALSREVTAGHRNRKYILVVYFGFLLFQNFCCLR